MRLLDDDGLIKTEMLYDEIDARMFIKRTQDVQPILDRNKELANDNTKGFSESGDLRYVASIPFVVIEQWIKTDGVNFLNLRGPERTAYLRRKLNDPDNRFLRTSAGQM
jgi:hypothetical protein|tara:strand:+ start:588 stop:914 length:327 start_codon:yes stop_codon:yes gene_type:complete